MLLSIYWLDFCGRSPLLRHCCRRRQFIPSVYPPPTVADIFFPTIVDGLTDGCCFLVFASRQVLIKAFPGIGRISLPGVFLPGSWHFFSNPTRAFYFLLIIIYSYFFLVDCF